MMINVWTDRFWTEQTSRCSCLGSSSPPAVCTDFLLSGWRTHICLQLDRLSAGPPAHLQSAAQIQCGDRKHDHNITYKHKSKLIPPGDAPSCSLQRPVCDWLLPRRRCRASGRRCRRGRPRVARRRRERRCWPQ